MAVPQQSLLGSGILWGSAAMLVAGSLPGGGTYAVQAGGFWWWWFGCSVRW